MTNICALSWDLIYQVLDINTSQGDSCDASLFLHPLFAATAAQLQVLDTVEQVPYSYLKHSPIPINIQIFVTIFKRLLEQSLCGDYHHQQSEHITFGSNISESKGKTTNGDRRLYWYQLSLLIWVVIMKKKWITCLPSSILTPLIENSSSANSEESGQ